MKRLKKKPATRRPYYVTVVTAKIRPVTGGYQILTTKRVKGR